jgi:hypothetical protein
VFILNGLTGIIIGRIIRDWNRETRRGDFNAEDTETAVETRVKLVATMRNGSIGVPERQVKYSEWFDFGVER